MKENCQADNYCAVQKLCLVDAVLVKGTAPGRDSETACTLTFWISMSVVVDAMQALFSLFKLIWNCAYILLTWDCRPSYFSRFVPPEWKQPPLSFLTEAGTGCKGTHNHLPAGSSTSTVIHHLSRTLIYFPKREKKKKIFWYHHPIQCEVQEVSRKKHSNSGS